MKSHLQLLSSQVDPGSLTARVLSDLQEGKSSAAHLSQKTEEAEEEEHLDERWLVSYADMMTLLFGFFVMMYASLNHFKSLQESLKSNFTADKSESIKTENADLHKVQAKLEESATRIATLEEDLQHSKKTEAALKTELRLAVREPCRICVSWTPIFDRQIAKSLGVRPGERLILTEVKSHGPGARAGLQVGDLVLKVNDLELSRSDEKKLNLDQSVHEILTNLPQGSKLRLEVLRAGKRIDLVVKLDSHEDEQSILNSAGDNRVAPTKISDSLTVAPLSVASRLQYYIPTSISGLLVVHSQSKTKKTPTVRPKLEPGDVIVSIDLTALDSAEQLKRISQAGPLSALVWKVKFRGLEFITLNLHSQEE